MDLDDGVVEVDQDAAVDPGQHRCALVQPRQQAGSDRVELADVTEAECPQERPQRRGRVRAVEDRAHRAVAQQRHVIDAVSAGEHPGDQGAHLRPGVGTLVSWHAQMLIGQRGQIAPLGQDGHRDQPGA